MSFLSAGKADPSPAPAGFHHPVWEEGTRGHSRCLALRGEHRGHGKIFAEIKLQRPPGRGCAGGPTSPVISSLSPGLKSMQWPCQADKGPGAQGHPCDTPKAPKPSQSSIHPCVCFPAKGSQKEGVQLCFGLLLAHGAPLCANSTPGVTQSTLEEDLRSTRQSRHRPQKLQGWLVSTQKSCSSPWHKGGGRGPLCLPWLSKSFQFSASSWKGRSRLSVEITK